MSLDRLPDSAVAASRAGQARAQCLHSLLQTVTASIRSDPTSFHLLLERAEILRAEYPELACADAYRAFTLCEPDIRRRLVRGIDMFLNPGNIGRWKERSLEMLSEILQDLGERRVASYYRDRMIGSALTSQPPPCHNTSPTPEIRADKPMLKRHRYPWQHKRRRKLVRVQENLKSWGLRIDKASFSDDPDILGVYAQQDFSTQDLLLEAPSFTVTLPRDPEQLGYEASTLLLRRLVVDCATSQEFLDSGLEFTEHPLIATLGATHVVPPDYFSFRHQIEQVQNHLNKSRRVFVDPRFDFDKLFEVYNRLLTNAFTHGPDPRLGTTEHIVGIAPLFSFFNHSCAPNVEWNFARARDGGDGIVLRARAARGLKRDEELFISYVQVHLLPQELEKRRKMLRDWIGGECMCARCAKQDAEEEEEVERMSQMSPRAFWEAVDRMDAEKEERKRREERAADRKAEAKRRRDAGRSMAPERKGAERKGAKTKAARRKRKVQSRKGVERMKRTEDAKTEDGLSIETRGSQGGEKMEEADLQGDQKMEQDAAEASEAMEGIEEYGAEANSD